MLIAQGRDILTLTTALDTVEKALSILDKVPVRDEEIAKAYVEFTLYRAIALKALGEFDEALGEVRSTAQRLRFQQEMSYLELIMLHRQEVMMLQDAKQYQKLAENSQQYANAKPVEYYGTIKRVFEFAMNRDLPDAAKIFPEFRRSYGAARQKLPLLSHVSFTKNVGQFLGQHGRPAAALKVLDAAKSAADRLNRYGQKRQIDALMDDVRQNTKNGLKTFSVGR
jgi:tetratricopeptide (TPR) repeat protein